MKLTTDQKLILELHTAIVVAGDLCGGFHLLKLEVWKEMAADICKQMKAEHLLPQMIRELEAADKRRKELS